eukprot:CAMPEP_0116822918 /NCGR_PEP_ID=MMETSP0418-20121206/544_1 /TAXON_ID=1158023 /ORGANISM="Astrosyne radiata, Strain 13vi08-1A" /LENGTH=39 /DNA_ID= /DNA_START= /DNA_END= /DNA_ORIENTATION=
MSSTEDQSFCIIKDSAQDNEANSQSSESNLNLDYKPIDK